MSPGAPTDRDAPPPRISCLHPALFLRTVRVTLTAIALALTIPALLLLWAKDRMKETICLGNHCHVACALRNYVADYAGHLPPAETWCDAIIATRHVRPEDFRCQTLRGTDSNVWLNEALAGVDLDRVSNPFQVVLTFEGADGWNRTGGPNDFLTPHHGRGNVSLLDGRYLRLNEGMGALDPERGNVTWRPEFASQASP